ncbi:MarR family transcriptional regulator [Undibacterium sp. RTI2.1]|uniref:MarR family winged helix-turn-helix transcriptional regulator n=1 Tax=unclassified Undibacterium TaxID=2630295 RepID=UPI002AB3E292|nr:MULTISPECIES: MarR family transcriptional regulator [unclassified Undibacterium]MDY7538159.1 MarR family transcriptional regulator [Undibacterium sp. 5I1]MEB0031617.1 MarR family transcriptional regulator [Undibacterium sp. RTI2.1]MEB0116759.1 MarR family transcriptional regulator [Undibacterium sp. RTI2.2]MEB0229562.1 MarR family transcriptional regulator [Undibacterium sp. 10I3]MEB0257359.1 MarR family transcriptional regulator [Undibacterium sp. 5I1]
MAQPSSTFPLDVYQVEESLGYLISRAKTMLSKSVDESVSKLGITHAQSSVFMMLATGKCETAAELARDLFIDAGAMKRMLDRLEVKGLLVRVTDESDKRLFKLELTQAGHELVQHLPGIYNDVLNIGFTGFSPEEIGFLRSLLKKLLANRTLLEQTAVPK